MRRRALFVAALSFCSSPILAIGASAGDATEVVAAPVFSNTGPEAAIYGEADGFRLGTRNNASEVGKLVATYSHFDELYPSRRVPRAPAPWFFKRAAEPKIFYTFNLDRFSIDDYLTRHPTTGLLIAKDDTILYEHYQYARTDRDRFLSQSMAKTITAMLIGIAVSEGQIKSIDDLTLAYVPQLANTEYGRTSIRDLLHMASGVSFTEFYDGKDDVARLWVDLFGGSGKDPITSVAQFNTRATPAATSWHYASVETEILGLVLRFAIGKPVAEYLGEKIWQQIGTEADATWAIDGSGQEVTFCCFNAVLRDYARLGRLLAHEGAWEGRQVIPRQWVMDATTVQPSDGYLAPRVATPFFGYGYQVWIFPGEPRRFALLGVRGQMILVDPTAKLVMVHTAVRQRPSDRASNAETIALWLAAVAQLGQ
jgi:CubicO group peptidase (beta-lactamase class C family)